MRKRLSSSQLEQVTYWIAGGLLFFFILITFGILPRFGQHKKSEISSLPQINLQSLQADHYYAHPDEGNIQLFTINVKTDENIALQRLKISSMNEAADKQLQSIQLYQNGIFIKEVPFLDTFGLFENLNLPLNGSVKLEIKGKIQHQAEPGKTLRIGLKQESDISFEDTNNQKISAKWQEKTTFPLWGDYITVIGS